MQPNIFKMKQTTQSTGLTSFHGSTVKATVNEMKEVLEVQKKTE